MKKTIIACLLLFGCTFCYSKDFSSKVFKDCFDKANENYEFNIRNPLFVEKFYVKNIKNLKNKIIKETFEYYSMDSDGKKSYDDSYTRTVGYIYYLFDSEGRITDNYYLLINENNIVFYKEHENYSCSKDDYKIIYEDLLREKSEIYNGIIKNKNGNLLLSFDNKYQTYNEFEFVNNKIVKRNISNSSTLVSEIIINNNEIQKNEYIIEKDKTKYNRILNLKNCSIMNEKRFVPSGDEFYNYELDNSDHGVYTYFKENSGKEKTIKQEVYRKFNPIGFLEYEEKKPYNSEIGNYSFRNFEILNEKDELFLKSFENK